MVEYIRNRKPNQQRGVCFSFWYKPDSVDQSRAKNKARAEIYYEYPGGSNTAIGLWVTPNETEWHMAQVKVSLPTNTQMVRVRIRGTYFSGQGFKAWIDSASLSVYYHNTKNDFYGDVARVASIYNSSSMQIPEFDGFVSLGVSIAAKSAGIYSIYKVRDFQVELLPNNGSATTQQGRLAILYFQQKNTKNFTIEPRTDQELINTATTNGQLSWTLAWIALDLAFTVATAGIKDVGKVLAIGLIWAVTSGAMNFAPFVPEKVHNPIAEGGSSYEVSETLDYSTKMTTYWDYIESAGADYYLDWRFKTDSDDVFAIRISATVEWGLYYDPNPEPPDEPRWEKIGETPVSIIISIANYWQ